MRHKRSKRTLVTQLEQQMKHTTVNEKENSGSYVFTYFRITLLHSIHDAVIEMLHYVFLVLKIALLSIPFNKIL
jgi:hypothetical protein